MSELLTVVEILNDKVKTLIDKLQSVQGELDMVKDENVKLNTEMVEKINSMDSLNTQIAQLQSDVEKGRGVQSDTSDARMKIDDMVREIDECIALIKE